MILNKALLAAALCVALSSSSAFAQELVAMEPDIAQGYGGYLTGLFEESLKGSKQEPQVKVEPDPTKAVGLLDGQRGILLVPSKSLGNTEEPDPAAQSEAGAGFAYLYMSPGYNPRIDGKLIEQQKLRTVTYMDDNGQEKPATCLILAARQVSEDDWRLYVYGAEKKPLIDSKFADAEEEKPGPASLHVADVKDGQGTLVVTVLTRYAAKFQIGHGE